MYPLPGTRTPSGPPPGKDPSSHPPRRLGYRLCPVGTRLPLPPRHLRHRPLFGCPSPGELAWHPYPPASLHRRPRGCRRRTAWRRRTRPRGRRPCTSEIAGADAAHGHPAATRRHDAYWRSVRSNLRFGVPGFGTAGAYGRRERANRLPLGVSSPRVLSSPGLMSTEVKNLSAAAVDPRELDRLL